MIVLEHLDRDLRNQGWHIRHIHNMNNEFLQLTLDFNDGTPWATLRIVNHRMAMTEDLVAFIKNYKEELNGISRDTP